MNVLVIEPMKHPVEKEISNELESLQKEVGGYIECIYPFDDEVGLICNEEGKLQGLHSNRGLYDENGELYDIIAGNFLIVGLTRRQLLLSLGGADCRVSGYVLLSGDLLSRR